MIDIPTSSYQKCDGVSRREYLRIGSLGLFGLTLPERFAPVTKTRTRKRQEGCLVHFAVAERGDQPDR